LSEPAKAKFLDLHEKYFGLGAIAMMFTTYIKMIHPDLPALPLRDRVSFGATAIPDALLDATAYGDLLDVLIPLGEQATAELNAALRPEKTAFSDFA
jgi:hypothetical protein